MPEALKDLQGASPGFRAAGPLGDMGWNKPLTRLQLRENMEGRGWG